MLKLFVAIFFLVKTIDADWIEECLQLKATAKSSWPDLALDPANQNYSEVALRNVDLPHHLLNRTTTGLFRRIIWRVVQSRHFQMTNLYQMYLQTDALIAELQLHLDKPAYRVLYRKFSFILHHINDYSAWLENFGACSLPPELNKYIKAKVQSKFSQRISQNSAISSESTQRFAVLAVCAWNYFLNCPSESRDYLVADTTIEDRIGESIGVRLQLLHILQGTIPKNYYFAFLDYSPLMLRFCPSMDLHRLQVEKRLLELWQI